MHVFCQKVFLFQLVQVGADKPGVLQHKPARERDSVEVWVLDMAQKEGPDLVLAHRGTRHILERYLGGGVGGGSICHGFTFNHRK